MLSGEGGAARYGTVRHGTARHGGERWPAAAAAEIRGTIRCRRRVRRGPAFSARRLGVGSVGPGEPGREWLAGRGGRGGVGGVGGPCPGAAGVLRGRARSLPAPGETPAVA